MWPWTKKTQRVPTQPKLVLKSPEAFIEMQCKYGETKIEAGRGIVALVLDASKEFGTGDPIKANSDNSQTAAIQVASDKGRFVTLASTPASSGSDLAPGDLVVWVPMKWERMMADAFGEHRMGWSGLILCKIAPEITPDGLKILVRYD